MRNLFRRSAQVKPENTIVAADPSKAAEVLRLGLERREINEVKLAIESGAKFEATASPELLCTAIRARDIEAIKVFAAGGFNFNAEINDLPILIWAMENFRHETDPSRITEIKNFLTQAAQIMFDAGARINVREGGPIRVGVNDQILSQHRSLARVALSQDYSLQIAKMIVERGGRDEISDEMQEALACNEIEVFKRSIAAGANVVGRAGVESPLTYASRNAVRGEFSDILMRAGADISFRNQEGRSVLQEVENAAVLNSIVFFTTLAQASNQNNWRLLQAHLQDLPNERARLSPLNQYLLSIFLPEGALRTAILAAGVQAPDLATLNQLEQTNKNLLMLCLPDGEIRQALGASSAKIQKLLEVKESLVEQFSGAGYTNPQLLANAVVIDLALKNPENLKEIVELHTVVAGVERVEGHRSILDRAFAEKVGKDLPDVVAANIQTGVYYNENFSAEINSHISGALKKCLNPSPNSKPHAATMLAGQQIEGITLVE